MIDHEEQSALELILMDAGFEGHDISRAIKEMDLDGYVATRRLKFLNPSFLLWCTCKIHCLDRTLHVSNTHTDASP